MKRIQLFSLSLLISLVVSLSTFTMEKVDEFVNVRKAVAGLIAGDEAYTQRAINYNKLGEQVGLRPEALKQLTARAFEQDSWRLEKEQLKGAGIGALALMSTYLFFNALVPEVMQHNAPGVITSALGSFIFTYFAYVLWKKLLVTPTIAEIGYQIATDTASKALANTIKGEVDKVTSSVKKKLKEEVAETSKNSKKTAKGSTRDLFKKSEHEDAFSSFRKTIKVEQRNFLGTNIKRLTEKSNPKKLLREITFLYALTPEQDEVLSQLLETTAPEKMHPGFDKFLKLLMKKRFKDRHYQTIAKQSKLFLGGYAPKLIAWYEELFVQSIKGDEELVKRIKNDEDIKNLVEEHFQAGTL